MTDDSTAGGGTASDLLGEIPSRTTRTKEHLAEVLSQDLGLNKREASEMVQRFFAEIGSALEAGREVKLAQFGRFSIRAKPARPGRNPATGQVVPIAPRRVVTFHPSQGLRQRVEGDKDRTS